MGGKGEHREIRTLKQVVVLYVCLFSVKLVAYHMSGVMAMLAEALHTLSDFFISGFLLLALLWSRKEADESHVFGHGRAQNIAALVAATLFISFTSLRLFEEALPRLFHHEAAVYGNLSIALWVLAVSIVIAAAPLVSLLRHGAKGAAAKAQLLELVNDELGLLAALAGTLFILAGHPIADPIASLVVAVIIAVNATILFRENVSYLLGKSPPAGFLERVEKEALSVPGVTSVHDIRAEILGPDKVHIDIHVTVKGTMTVEEAHGIADGVGEKLQALGGSPLVNVRIDAEKSGHGERGVVPAAPGEPLRPASGLTAAESDGIPQRSP